MKLILGMIEDGQTSINQRSVVGHFGYGKPQNSIGQIYGWCMKNSKFFGVQS